MNIMKVSSMIMGMLYGLWTAGPASADEAAGAGGTGNAADAVNSLEAVAAQQIDTFKSLITMIVEFVIKYFFQVLGGIIVLVLGWMLANFVADFVSRILKKNNLDITVSKFIIGGVKLGIMSFAIIVALGKFGIEIAPLIAGISVIGFGTSFALQGPLSNYASGAALIFTKPFKVGDIIEVAGVVGEVRDLKLPRTELKTVDGDFVNIPNKHIVGEIIHNYTDKKRLDINVGVSYDSDLDKAIALIREVIKAEPKVSQEREAKIGVSAFADSSVNIYARIWCKQDNYWDAMFSLHSKIFAAFQKNGVTIPFPQRDVHIIEGKM